MNRGLLGGSHTSLDRVYQGTTLPKKKAIGNMKRLALGAKARRKLEPLLNQMTRVPTEKEPLGKLETVTTMPSVTLEETALLGVLPLDNMDDIELSNIRVHRSHRISLDATCTEARVRTDRGDLLVAMQGDRTKPAILTYHDLGLNSDTCFAPFFNFVDMRALLQNFCVYHVTAPGQEEGAPTLPEDFVFPSLNELADQLRAVLAHFGIRSFIGFGVGAGANILARFALMCPNRVEALALINCTSTPPGWIEWAYQKLNSRALRASGMTDGVLDYLMWHHFGRLLEQRSADLIRTYRMYFTRHINPTNLSLFIDAYVRRDDLGISREGRTIRMPVLNVTGAMSPHVDDTVTLNTRLPLTNATWMKISDCALAMEEQPARLAEAFRLFLQGEGYVAPLTPSKLVLLRNLPSPTRRRACRHSPVIRITENPISEAVAC